MPVGESSGQRACGETEREIFIPRDRKCRNIVAREACSTCMLKITTEGEKPLLSDDATYLLLNEIPGEPIGDIKLKCSGVRAELDL